MPLNDRKVQLIHASQAAVLGTFLLDEDIDGDNARLTLRSSVGEFTGEASDFFEAMCKVRDCLESIRWRPVCYGSSRNVFPSGMCRDMGRGLKAYRLELGRHTTTKKLVSIFDSGPDVEPSSVAEQRRFWEEWLRTEKK